MRTEINPEETPTTIQKVVGTRTYIAGPMTFKSISHQLSHYKINFHHQHLYIIIYLQYISENDMLEYDTSEEFLGRFHIKP
jgi:hypothetical protein